MTADEAMAKAALAYLPATYKRAIQLLAEEETDTTGLAKHLGMTLGSAYKLVMVLRELKVIRIAKYVRLTQRGAEVRIWGLGEKNIRRPPKMTPAQRTAAYRERLNKSKLNMWGMT